MSPVVIGQVIRESPALGAYEKLFLWTLLSHHNSTMFASLDVCRDWMCMSVNTFYKTRNQLLAKGILTAQRQGAGATVYRFNVDGLESLRESLEPVPISHVM